MDSALSDILELLEDGKWHRVGDLSLRTGINCKKLFAILSFLEKFGFLIVDNKNSCVKLREDIRDFLLEIQRSC